MNQSVCNHTMRISLPIILLLLLVFGEVPAGLAQQTDTGVQWGQATHIPSPEEASSWFPDLAVDQEGRVHVVWCETNHLGVQDRDPESLYYSIWDGQQWSQANDIVPPQQAIIRTAIAVDGYGVLHLLFDHPARPYGFGLYYKQALAGEALSAATWTSPRLVNGRRGTYMSDIAVHRDTLHIVYDDAGAEDEEGECPGCADIFYRRSTDRGLTWSAPINLMATPTGSSRAQMEVDSAGTIHVAWDEGWDRLTGRGNPQYSVYMYSADGGSTWAAPTVISYPDSTNAQLSVGSDGWGGVMLVWRATSREYPGIYYMWSMDGGGSWSPPQAVPNIVARQWSGPFDLYDMATDSAGHIHLLVVGHLSTKQVASSVEQGLPGLYHFKWDESNWSAPVPVYEGDWYPEYPHLVIERGNQLHATWFVRKDPWEEVVAPYQVWYAHGQSQAPAETPVPRPSLTPTAAPVAVSTATPLPTLYPTIAPGSSTLPTGLYTESDELLRLAVALLPLVVLALLVIIVRLGRSKLFR